VVIFCCAYTFPSQYPLKNISFSLATLLLAVGGKVGVAWAVVPHLHAPNTNTAHIFWVLCASHASLSTFLSLSFSGCRVYSASSNWDRDAKATSANLYNFFVPLLTTSTSSANRKRKQIKTPGS